MQTQREWLSRGQAAARANVTKRTIDRWLACGRLTRHRRNGWAVLVDASELARATQTRPDQSAS